MSLQVLLKANSGSVAHSGHGLFAIRSNPQKRVSFLILASLLLFVCRFGCVACCASGASCQMAKADCCKEGAACCTANASCCSAGGAGCPADMACCKSDDKAKAGCCGDSCHKAGKK